MVDLFLSSFIFIATAFIGVHGNPILGGCVVQSSLALADCERDVRFRFGYKNDTATDCCVYWALYDCFQDELNKRCPKDRIEILQRFIHADGTIKVNQDCRRFPNRFWCEIHFIGFWFSLIFIILAIIVFIIFMVFLILFLKRRFIRRKDRRPVHSPANNSNKEIRQAAPLANSKIDDL